MNELIQLDSIKEKSQPELEDIYDEVSEREYDCRLAKGAILSRLRNILIAQHGDWENYLQNRFALSKMTATRYIHAFYIFSQVSQIVTDVNKLRYCVNDSILYEIDEKKHDLKLIAGAVDNGQVIDRSLLDSFRYQPKKEKQQKKMDRVFKIIKEF